MSASVSDVLIVGGGLVGLATADAALRRGLSVTVLERERFGARASWAGAGMLNNRPWPRTQDPDYHDLMRASLRLHEEWAARLRQETEIDPGHVICGALEIFVAGDSQAAEQSARLLEGAAERGVRAERVGRERIRELEPQVELSAIDHALLYPDDGQVRNPRLAKALIASCRQRGARMLEAAEVADLALEGVRAVGAVTADGRRFEAKQVVVCAGAWTGTFKELAQRVPRIQRIEPVRGQLVCYQTEPGMLTRLLTAEHRYLVPRPDGLLLVGSTMERVGFDTTTTPEGQAELRAFAERWLPALVDREPVQGWADVRPGLKGSHPIMGPVPGMTGLFVAAGHFRNGIGLAPITGEILAALLAGLKPPIPIEPWLPRAAQD